MNGNNNHHAKDQNKILKEKKSGAQNEEMAPLGTLTFFF